MENTVQITPELYEQIKKQVLEEQKAAVKARTEERAKRRKECDDELAKAGAMFEQARLKYTPLLAERYKHAPMRVGWSLYDVITAKFDEARDIALRTLGYRDVLDAYRDNKADEANKLLGEILDAILKQ